MNIHKVRKEGKVHRWIDDWSVSPTQYPEHPLTHEQEQSVARLTGENFKDEHAREFVKVGTVALYNSTGMAIVSDSKYPDSPGDAGRKVSNIWSGHNNPRFPIGTRVVYGPVYRGHILERTAVFKL